MDLTGAYWEIYDDQESKDFDFVHYKSLKGDDVVVAVEDNLARQCAEIYRVNGKNTEIKVYRKKG